MRALAPLLAAFLALPCAAAGPKGRTAPRARMELTSAAFRPNATIPVRHTCTGDDLSPPLAWSGLPAGTKSFALVMDDPDAPVGTWVHWVLYDIPASLKGLPEGVARKDALPDGSKHGQSWGVESFSKDFYSGPCPPPGRPHRYVFTLYALDAALGLPAKLPVSVLKKAMKGHILAQAELIGLYGR